MTPTAITRNGRRIETDDWRRVIEYHNRVEETAFYPPRRPLTDTTFHVLRGNSCDAELEGRDDTCCFTAATRRYTDGGVEEYCLTHTPSAWNDALRSTAHHGDDIIDLRVECEHDVVNTEESGFGESADPDRPAEVHTCGDQAFLLVTDTDDYSKAFCKTHARDSWLSSLRIETGVPGSEHADIESEPAWHEHDGVDDWTWIDGETGDTFENHVEWSDVCSGRYGGLEAAKRVLVVVDGEGRPVMD